jgi:hypothetical protein
VQSCRNHLFARTRLTFNQHRSIRRSGGSDDGANLAQLRIVADDSEVVAIAYRRTLVQPRFLLDCLKLQGSLSQN